MKALCDEGEVVSSIHMATTMKTAAGVLDRMWRMLRPHFFPLVPLSPRGLPRQSRASEFTLPVIYSMDERSKLVFLIEARPEERPERLRVGQLVSVALGRAE